VTSVRQPDGSELDRRIDLFGTEVRILVGAPLHRRALGNQVAAVAVEQLLRRHHALLTRFDPDSELSRLNADPREEVPISALLAEALRAALHAAELTEGLVDPGLLGELERAGYESSRLGVEPADLREALLQAPPRCPGRGRPDADWRTVEVGDGFVRRPPGMRFDLGGSAKGHAADSAAARLGAYDSFAVDVGGDIVIGGNAGAPRVVGVEHPLGQRNLTFRLGRGAIATSGLARRIWRTPSGFAHHLIDPSTGRPAWTGVVQATAVAPTGVQAEPLAKAALLSGPEAGLRMLEPGGGVLVLDDGTVRLAGPAAQAVRSAA
jgi:thiamine biosynthesis lipoprotein